MQNRRESFRSAAGLLAFVLGSWPLAVAADETCMSPYMAKIVGQEDFVYVWTLGMPGVGDAQDKLVTVDVNPKSATYGKPVHQLSVGSRNEAHHSGLTDDRNYLWASGLDTNKIFLFDVHTDPSKPKLHKTIEDFVAKSGGVVGPHTLYALPGRMMVTGLSNSRDHGGRTGLVEYTNDGAYVATHWMPTAEDLRGAHKSGTHADGYGYDVRALPRRNAFFTSSFTGWNNYMMDLGKLLADQEALKHFGNTMIVWNLHTRQPKKILDVPGAPLEIRCAWGSFHNYCFTGAALTSKLWLVYEDETDGEWKSKEIADVADASKLPLLVDISMSADDRFIWANTWNDGTTRLFDVSDPHHAKQVYEQKIGEQVNMVSQSWDGKRVYFTSSLLSNWDKKTSEKGDLQFFKAYDWDGTKLTPKFTVDFLAEKLGAPHQMRFGARSLYAGPASDPQRKEMAAADKVELAADAAP